MDERSIYIGNRYVPKIEGEWNQLKEYEGLSIVTSNGNSYTSKKMVPEGVSLSNEEYWVKTGDTNAELVGFKNDVTAQLAQTNIKSLTENIVDSTSLNIASKKESRPIITIVDDDGREEVYSRLKPILESRGVSATLAVVSDWVGRSDNIKCMSKTQLLELQSMGWEIASHEKTHAEMSNITDERTIKNELITSKTKLLEMGFDVKNLIYPFGQRNDILIKIAKQVYKVGASTSNGYNNETNKAPLNNFNLRRVALGSYEPVGYDTLEYHKATIDKAISEGSWLIFMTHIWAQTPEKDQLIADVIDYALSKNIEIKTLNEGLDAFGDRVSIDNLFRILPDDSILSDKLVVNVVDTSLSDYLKASDVDFIKKNYTKNHIIHTKINTTNLNGFPENRPGFLITDLTSNENGYIKQVYKTYGNDDEYRRTTNASGVFSEFKLVTLRTKNTIISNYEVGIVPAHSTKEVTFDVSGVTAQDNIVVSPMSATQAGYIWSGRAVLGKVVLRVANVTPDPITVLGNNWKFVIIKG